MRQLHVRIPDDTREWVLELARRHGADAPSAIEVRQADGVRRSLVILDLPNDCVGGFIEDVAAGVEDAKFVLFPAGVLPIRTPVHTIREQVRDVTRRSTLELVVGSLQSLGSWRGMLLYALFSGAVAAYAVLFNTSYLLTAAMLIAPMGAPAMVCVIGTAIGDARMVGRGLVRFWIAIAMLTLTALALGAAYGLEFSTATMEQIAALSGWVVMLAVLGGAAGALSLVLSDRDSLVTATATGFLVAVALSPPSATLGLAIWLARWDYVGQLGFLVVLTFFGIIAGGWAALTLYGVRPADLTASRGARRTRTALAAAAVLLTTFAVIWQAQQAPSFRKADLSRQAVEATRAVVRAFPAATIVEAGAHFTRPDLDAPDAEGILVNLTVATTRADPDALSAALRDSVSATLRRRLPDVLPFVDLTVLPESSAAAAPL